MSTNTLPSETDSRPIGNSEQGLLLAVLAMVVLGVVGMFLMSA